MTAPSLPMQPEQRRQSRKALVNHLLVGFLSMVFLAAAIAKTMSFRELEATLIASKLVPMLVVSPIGVLLLVTEYLVALLLLIPKTRLSALHAASVLCGLFAAYSTWRWMKGISVPCTCFGALFKLEPWQSLLLNTALLGIIIQVKLNPTFSAKNLCSVQGDVNE